MLCQKCQKRVANVHFTQIVNNSKVEFYICDQCASENGQFQMGLSMSDFFNGIMGFGEPDSFVASAPVQQTVCEKCGMTYEMFQKTGKLGCADCYTLFSDRIRPLIKRLHGTVEHTGKMPQKVSKSLHASKELEGLKELLAQAIQSEEYERAAELRDRIKAMETAEGS